MVESKQSSCIFCFPFVHCITLFFTAVSMFGCGPSKNNIPSVDLIYIGRPFSDNHSLTT